MYRVFDNVVCLDNIYSHTTMVSGNNSVVVAETVNFLKN